MTRAENQDTLARVEQMRADDEGVSKSLPVPPAGRATAQPPPDLAKDPAILSRFRAEIGRRGVVGEETTACIAYLVLTSRLLDKQASLAVKGHSASGKSWTIQKTLEFFPPEAVVEMTAMSEKALVYSDRDYRHKTLVLYEATALRENAEDNLTAYFVRSLLSEGRIEYPTTVRDGGGFTTRTIVKEGPTNLIVTTTKARVHAENETRLLSVTTDDTQDQTGRVFGALADEGDRDGDITEWIELQEWLAEDGDHDVTIPFAPALARLVPPVAVRLRRDFGTLLALIRAHAVLHQVTRDRNDNGRIIATHDDYEVVRDLVGPVIAEGVASTVSHTVRQSVEAVAGLCAGDDEKTATAIQVAGELHVDKSTATRRLGVAAAGGWVVNIEDRRGRPGRWRLGDPLPDDVDLLPPRNRLQPEMQPPSEGEAPGQETASAERLRGCGSSGEKKKEPPTDDRPRDPNTGKFLCWKCGDPMDAALGTARSHPTCDPDEVVT